MYPLFTTLTLAEDCVQRKGDSVSTTACRTALSGSHPDPVLQQTLSHFVARKMVAIDTAKRMLATQILYFSFSAVHNS